MTDKELFAETTTDPDPTPLQPNECRCLCHRHHGILHFFACCEGRCEKCKRWFGKVGSKGLLKRHTEQCQISNPEK